MRHFLILVAVSTALPSPASAQSFHQAGQYSEADRRVSVGLTIPLGSGGSRSERQPRVDLTFDHRRRDASGLEIRDGLDFRQQRPVRLGFTLTEQPQLMLNGTEVSGLNDRHNVSKAGWIGIGVAATVVTLGLGLWVAIETQGPTD